jgi:hypothetical protein
MMKNYIACLIALSLFSTGLVMADGGKGNNNKGQKKGPPNQVNQGGNQGGSNRKQARQPLNLSGQGQGQKGGQGQGQKGGQGQGQKGGQGNGTGMQKKRPPLSQVLGLKGPKAQKVDALGKAHHQKIESIHDNKELSEEQKLIAIRAAHQKFDNKLKELLDDDELAKLQLVRLKNANPENGNQNAGGMDPLRIKVLELTDEQIKKLTAARQFAAKKKMGILTNKELSATDKKKALHAVEKQHKARVAEILTDEQLALMKKINQAATQLAGKGGNNQNSGKPGASGGE